MKDSDILHISGDRADRAEAEPGTEEEPPPSDFRIRIGELLYERRERRLDRKGVLAEDEIEALRRRIHGHLVDFQRPSLAQGLRDEPEG